MLTRFIFIRCFLFVVMGWKFATLAQAANDVDPLSWGGVGATQVKVVFGIDNTNTVVQLTTIYVLIADANYKLNHVVESGGTNYAHGHFWDKDANNGNGANDYSTANQGLAQTYWDFAFGVSPKTGNGKLDGDTVTRTTAPGLNLECAAFAFGVSNCPGVFNWSFADGNTADAARQVVTKAGNKANVQVHDLLYYSNGGFSLGYHFTTVDAVDKNNQPQTLRWKFTWSGIFSLARTQNLFNTPMYWAGGKAGAGVSDWKFSATGAGGANNMTVYSPK